MQKLVSLRAGLLLAAALAAGLVAAFYAARSGAGSSSGVRVVMTAKNKALGKTILVNRSGLSLYSLSVERRGKFICTNSSCLSLWKPLVIRRGMRPTGVHGLGTVKRPDGRIQVTYGGRPLYRFVEDHKRGDVKGNGFKDVGTWRVATVGKQAATPPPPTYTYPMSY